MNFAPTVVVLKDIDYEDLTALVEFIYSGQVMINSINCIIYSKLFNFLLGEC